MIKYFALCEKLAAILISNLQNLEQKTDAHTMALYVNLYRIKYH